MVKELASSREREKIPAGQTLLMGEPVFKVPDEDQSNPDTFSVPSGCEAWIEELAALKPTNEDIAQRLKKEYASIAFALKDLGVPFRIVISHRDIIDEAFTVFLLASLGIRGLQIRPQVSETAFPRDIMVDFDGRPYINPNANFQLGDNSGIFSPLGEGGRVLKQGKKVLVPDSRGYIQTRKKYKDDVASLSRHFQFGFLPHPWAMQINTRNGSKHAFPNDHLDRVASFVRGKDEKDYLLLDKNYVDQKGVFGGYWDLIKETSKKMDINPIAIERPVEAVPYALNLEQFADGSVLVTQGDKGIKSVLEGIVGEDKVKTTDYPVIYYPLYRGGGIRCMLLFAPQKIVGEPLVHLS